MALHILTNIGTSYLQHEYLIDYLEQHYNDKCIIYLLYGKPAGKNNPLLTANKIKEYAETKGFETKPIQIGNPFDLEKCKEEYKNVISSLNLSNEDRVIVSMAGGTNPMLFSMLLATINYLPMDKVEFVYVEGVTESTDKSQMKLHKLSLLPIENIINELRAYSYHKALYYSQMLPDTHEYNFVKGAINGLYWETFDYERAASEFNRIRGYAELLREQGKYDNLPDVVIRLHTRFSSIRKEYNKLKSITNSPEKILYKLEGSRIRELFKFLIADMLLNASRKFIEGLYTDCIIRCYRSVEMCIQMLLLLDKINPWYVKRDDLPDRVRDKYNDGDKLNLYQGLECLGMEGDNIIKDIKQARNNSILAHGFIIQDMVIAERILSITTDKVVELLSAKGIDFRDIIESLAHNFSSREVELLWKTKRQ